MLVSVLQLPSLHWEILIILLQFPLTFHQTQKVMSLFIAQLTTILMLIRTVIVITWEITWFTFAAGTDLCEWVQVGIYKYISLIVNIRSSLIPWFSVSFAGAIAQRNLFIHLYQQNKSSVSKLKFKHASNRCKKFLKLPNLLMLIKQKRLLLPKNLALSKYVIPSLFNVPKVFSFDHVKAKLSAKTSKNPDLADSV